MMQHNIEIGDICWIKADPHPLTSPALQAGLLSPSWIPKTIVGLVATANTQPPPVVNDFNTLALGTNHRAMIYCRLKVDVDDNSGRAIKVTSTHQFISKGWTPPFKANRLGSSIMSVASKLKRSMQDPNPYPGETSSVSNVVTQARHPNTAIPNTPRLHTVIANALVKFRAGPHTDKIGIEEAESPFHVPWVWSEFLLTYVNGHYHLTVLGSVFPTHTWYVQGKQVITQREVSDSSFPTEGILGTTIVPKALNLYPALSTGVPVPASQAPCSETPAGPLPTHLYTVSGGESQSYTFKP